MQDYQVFSETAPTGTIVVKLVQSENGPRAFIRQVADPDDFAESSIEQSEELPVEEALALARNKAANIDGGAQVVIEMGPDAAWDEKWGRLI